MHSASASAARVVIVYLSMNLLQRPDYHKDCQSSQPPALCIYMEASSNVCLKIMYNYEVLQQSKVQRNYYIRHPAALI